MNLDQSTRKALLLATGVLAVALTFKGGMLAFNDWGEQAVLVLSVALACSLAYLWLAVNITVTTSLTIQPTMPAPEDIKLMVRVVHLENLVVSFMTCGGNTVEGSDGEHPNFWEDYDAACNEARAWLSKDKLAVVDASDEASCVRKEG